MGPARGPTAQSGIGPRRCNRAPTCPTGPHEPPQLRRSPCRTWWNPANCLKPPLQNLVKPWCLVEPYAGTGGTLAKPDPKALVEPSWNLTANHPAPPRSPCRTWWTFQPPRTTPALVEPGGTLVEPSWNLTSNHPGPQPSQNLVERWWNPRGTLPQTTPDHPAALAELGGARRTWWNAGGTLVESHPGPPRSPCRTWWNLVEPS